MTWLNIVSVLQFFGVIILVFGKSYASKKAENQATKEDIGNITEIVEGIKKDLADNTEKLKAELTLKNEHIISLRVFERNSIINYYKILHGLVSYLLRIDLTIYSLENFKEIDNIQINIEKEFYNYDLAEGDVELFLDTQVFIDEKKNLNLSLIELQNCIILTFLGLKYEFQFTSTALENPINSKLDLNNELRRKIHEIRNKYYKERSEKYVEILKNISVIKRTLTNRLIEISKF